MIPVEELRELQAEFEPIRLESQSRYNGYEKLRREFVRLFPPSRILGLTLDEYVQGRGSTDSYCYWLERRTADLGHIQGSPAIKFGIYYSKEPATFRFKGQWSNASDALQAVLGETRKLIEAGKNHDMAAIRATDISPMVKGKLLFLYFPNIYLNIFSERHVDHFLRQFRLNTPGAQLDLISKRGLLTEFKNADDVMKEWTPYQFSDFLYRVSHPPSRLDKVPLKLKGYTLNFPAPEDTNPDFIDLDVGEVGNRPDVTTGDVSRNESLDQRNRRNKLTGNQGEDVVLLAEKNWLCKCGKQDLAQRVQAVCKTNDSAGYDVLSFELDGREKQIEVKSTIGKAPGPKGHVRFHLSANEHRQAQKCENYYLYVVFEVTTKRPKIWRIPNPTRLVPKRLLLEPSAYVATLTVT